MTNPTGGWGHTGNPEDRDDEPRTTERPEDGFTVQEVFALGLLAGMAPREIAQGLLEEDDRRNDDRK